MKQFLFLLMVVALASCSWQPRLYRPGFYHEGKPRMSATESAANAPVENSSVPGKTPGQVGNFSTQEKDTVVLKPAVRTAIPVNHPERKKQPVVRKEKPHHMLFPPAGKIPPDRVSVICGGASVALMVGTFIPSPIAFAFVVLSIIAAILAIVYGARAKKQALAAGEPVPRDARVGMSAGIVVLSLYFLALLLILTAILALRSWGGSDFMLHI